MPRITKVFVQLECQGQNMGRPYNHCKTAMITRGRQSSGILMSPAPISAGSTAMNRYSTWLQYCQSSLDVVGSKFATPDLDPPHRTGPHMKHYDCTVRTRKLQYRSRRVIVCTIASHDGLLVLGIESYSKSGKGCMHCSL